MPLSIKDIKKDLMKWNILEDSYESFEKNIPEKQRVWNCTINDYLVQIWINLKLEVDKTPPAQLLTLIPHEQAWFKKCLIKMLVGRKVFDFSPVADALSSCSAISQDERNYIFLHAPIRGKSH